MHSLPSSCFTTPVWAALLRDHGWVVAPYAEATLPLKDAQGAVCGHWHVVQMQAGGQWRSASNYYTSEWGVVPTGVPPCGVDWAGTAQALRALPGPGVVRLDPLAAEGEVLQGLKAALGRQGLLTSTYFCFGNWYTPLAPGGFGVYWHQRPSTLRHTVERATRKLDRLQPGWRMVVVTGQDTPEQVEQALAAYQAVYAQSWKVPEPAVRFVPELVRLAARQGWLRLGVLYLQDQPVAAQLWLVSEGTAHIFKLAYVQGMEKWSVGSVLTAHLMRHVIDVDGVRELDYGQGDDAYKKDWMTHRRERVGLLVWDLRRPGAWWPALRHGGGRWLRRLGALWPVRRGGQT
ncbi:MAG: hypothetical protein RJA09_523 [Pseudomonadota bacterium]